MRRAFALLDRHKDRMPDLAFDVLRQVTLPGGVLDQDHLAGADYSAGAMAGGAGCSGVLIPQRDVFARHNSSSVVRS
jgi:hypothetical protein